MYVLKNIAKIKNTEITCLMLRLWSDYIFPSYPQIFGLYLNNAGYLSKPLFELLVLDYSLLTRVYSNLPT